MLAKLAPSDQPGSSELASELERCRFNPCVGQKLVAENERVRVWSIKLRPGERLPFHRHVLDYFWTAISNGRAISHTEHGVAEERFYRDGETQFLSFGPGAYKVHDLENIGDTELGFTTVEFLQSSNQPLPLPKTVVRES
jgi:hypothetical protein